MNQQEKDLQEIQRFYIERRDYEGYRLLKLNQLIKRKVVE